MCTKLIFTVFCLLSVTGLTVSINEYNISVTCWPCFCHVTEGEMVADCSSKGLSSVPQSLPSSTTQLNLASNQIYSVTDSLKRYTSLRLLNISSNRLTSFNKDDFVAQISLLTLDLHGNHLKLSTKIFPPGLFQRQGRLQVLMLHKNCDDEGDDLHYPDQTLKDLTSLEKLHIDGLRSFVLGEGFANLRNLTTLSFDGYCSVRILSGRVFRYVPSVRFLDISNCQIINIEKSAFEDLHNIHTLDISNNVDLGTPKLGQGLYGLKNSSLKILKANHLHRNHGMGVFLKKRDIQYLSNTELEELHMSSCRLELIDPAIPLILPRSLKFLDLSVNKLNWGLYMLSVSYMENLKIVNASFQEKSHVSPFKYSLESEYTECPYSEDEDEDDYQHSFTWYLSKLNLSLERNFSRIVGNMTIYVPPNGEYLDLSSSKLSFPITQISFGPNKLKTLNLSHNFFYTWEGPVTGLDHLEDVDMSNNYCDRMYDNFGAFFPSLKRLDVSNNFLGYTLTENSFQNPNLTVLDLSENKINKLPKNLFQHTKVLERLTVSHNYLTSWYTNIDHLENLTFLDLSYNLLEDIPVKLTSEIDKIAKPELVVILSNNPFKCDCDTLPSLKWMDKSGRSMVDVRRLSCNMGQSNTSLQNLHDIVLTLEKNCRSYVGMMIGMVGVLVLVLALTLGGLVYRYRWKLRYMYYLTRNKHRGYLQDTQDEEDHFEFDAFISYADEDRSLVVGDMRRILEDQGGLQLCIHHRDFLVGEAIAANILNAVASSRRTVVILSRNFLRSYWCKYEVEMAKMEGIRTGRNTLLIVVLEKVPVKNLFSDIVVKMKEDSYLEYTDDREGQVVFWHNLKRAITTA